MAAAAAPSDGQTMASTGSLQMKETKKGKVYVGELSPEFLRIPAPAPPPQLAAGGQPLAAQQQMLAQPMPMVTSHRLIITVIEAKLNKNYGMTKMDPYCRLRMAHGIFETPTATGGGKSPYWGKTLSSIIALDMKGIDIEIYDERAFSTDSRIAFVNIPITKELRKGESLDNWWPLSGKLGEEKEGSIHLQISIKQQLSPYPPQMMMPQMTMPAAGYVIPPGVQIGAPGMMPPPQPRPPPITAEDLKQMKEMFPDTDDDVIKTVLEASGGNKDAAINSLLAMQC